MRSFNVLVPAECIFGKKVLEASAGTGKTFAIEHLVARLLKEAPQGEEPLALNQILVITFTRAAARELRMRIHATLKKRGLSFDGEQIFTIHGFCQKMVIRFGLEAGLFLFDQEPKPRVKFLTTLLKFLQTQEILCPEQLGILLSRRSPWELCRDLLEAPCPKVASSFSDTHKAIQKMMEEPRPLSDVWSEFERLQEQFKIGTFKRDALEEQLSSLSALAVSPSDPKPLQRLLFHRGTLFEFLSEENRKARIKEKLVSPLFEWAIAKIAPKIKEASNPRNLLATLRFAAETVMEEGEFSSHELLIQRCKQALENEEFRKAVQGSYQAVIIDEFQDTDAIQWEMIDRLFRDSSRLFCLVGDPKQSIYRFRKADLYSYFRARFVMGEEACYSLDTNYRSSRELLSALNDLFSDEHVEPWLLLPRERRACSYLPLKAGILSSSPVEGSSLQFFTADPLSYAAAEIAKLKSEVRSIAILVRDHREAAEARLFLEERGIAAVLKNTKPLGKTFAARAWEEFFDALYDPGRKKPFLMGPFSKTSLSEWRELLDGKGFPALLREATPQESSFMQIAEFLLEIKNPTFEEIKRFFRTLETEEIPCRAEQEEEFAVRILTMHASKGLEFDLVFALGVRRAPPREDEDLEEVEAEKFRQLYVALTRAKWRLYIPLFELEKGSPLAAFFMRSKLGNNPLQIVESLCEKNLHIGLDHSIPPPLPLASKEEKERPPSPKEANMPLSRSRIYSFTSLSKKREMHPSGCSVGALSLHTLPRGVEFGVFVHRIFERIFLENKQGKEIVAEEVAIHALAEWEGVLQEFVSQVVLLPFLAQAQEIRAEVEFLFSDAPHYVKGFVDLLFLWEGRLYFLDWKTNWLGADDEAYREDCLLHAMEANDYWLQASLYAKALRSSFPHIPFGGAFYFFLRGFHAKNRGIIFLEPNVLC